MEAVPMYNLTRGPSERQAVSFYISGDTEGVPEMKFLKNITMPPEEAAEAVMAFPKVFETALKDSGVEVRLLNWYY